MSKAMSKAFLGKYFCRTCYRIFDRILIFTFTNTLVCHECEILSDKSIYSIHRQQAVIDKSLA